MKKCPFCAEEIQDEAIVCKHCGRDLGPDSTEQWYARVRGKAVGPMPKQVLVQRLRSGEYSSTIQVKKEGGYWGLASGTPDLQFKGSKKSSSMKQDNPLKGLGGWLVLVGLGVVLSPVKLLAETLPLYYPIFTDGTWEVQK